MLYIATHQMTLVVSHNGFDVNQCGVDFPCQTIIYTLSKRARSNDIIQIDNQDMEVSQPYVIDVSSPFLENIKLTGINGRPVVTAKNPMSGTYLFEDKVKETQGNLSNIAIRVENICFTSIGIVRVKKTSSNLMVHIINSTVSQLMYNNTASIIDSSAIMTMVLIQNSLLRNIMKGVCPESAHSKFKILDSKVLYDEQKLISSECPQLIVTGEFVSLSAHFIGSKFKQIILTDLKSTEQKPSKVSIIDSVFDDGGISNCSSHMRISDSTLLIANSSFTKIVTKKQLIHVSSSFVVLQKCIFKHIQSFLSPLEISLKSVDSINDCRFENNTGLNGAVIHASLNSVLNINQCVFERNRAKSQGGALMFNQTLSINISGCLFINNHAENQGGAIYYQGNKLFLNTTVFINNTARRSGAAIISGSLSSVFNVIHCEFKRNKVEKFGGIILLWKTFNANISHCLFTENYLGERYFYGGTIAVLSGNKLTVSNTEFTNNTGYHGAAVYAKFISILNIVQCVFKRKKPIYYGGALYSFNTSTINILRCLFKENHSRFYGGAIFSDLEDKLIVSDTTFIGNTVKFVGGAISVMNLIIICSSFRKNKAGYGGAIAVRRFSDIKNTTFEHNLAEYSNRSGGGRGGAIYMYPSSKGNISDCLFEDNMATLVGGSVYSMVECSLSIKRTLFQINSYSSRYRHSRGLILHSSGKLIWEGVSFQDLDEYNAKNSLIMHASKFQGLKINRINITCSTGKDILAAVPRKPDRRVFLSTKSHILFTVSCSSCSSYTYSLSSGKLGPDLTNQSHINCNKCPFGGNCTHGLIKAASNFWGYIPKRSTDQIHFSACPFGYGCSGSSCSHYDSCGTGRKGVLCGQCKKGLTENIVSHDCLSAQKCRHPLLWLIVLIGGIVYVLSLLFLKEVANLFITVLVPKSFREPSDKNIFGRIKDSSRNLLHQNLPAQLLMNDICCEQSKVEDVHHELLDTTEYTTEGMNYNKSHTSLFPGMFKIVLFFNQSSVLFKVFSITKSHGFTHIMQEVIATLFNLRTDGVFSQDISWCPFDNLQPVPKVLFKASFILYLFAIIVLIFLIFKISKMVRKGNDHQSQTFYSRICCCVLKLLLISYSTITVTCFSLLSCVNLDSIGNVLFIDGSIQCYTWWQFIVITIVCIWIASLPIAIYAASWLLHLHMVSARKFPLSLLLPLPTIIYWLYVRITNRNNNELEAEMEDEKRPSENAEEMQDLLEGPFHRYHGAVNDRKWRLSWESIFIGRRLILIFVKTFVTDALFRLYMMLFFMFLFTLHHIYIRPFTNDFLNLTELISLCILSIICALNILPAFIYMNPMATSVYIQTLADIFHQIETILMLVFPSVIGFIVAILVTVRVLQFLVWMFRLFVRLIGYCCK